MSKTIALSSLFNNEALAGAFDGQCAKNAAQGKVYQPLADALSTAYGLTMPHGSAAFIKAANMQLFTLDKLPTLAHGKGRVAAVVTMVNAVHQYCAAIIAGMSDKSRLSAPELASLPAWADLVKIQEKKAKAKAARDAKKLDNLADTTPEDNAPDTAAEEAPEVTPERDLRAEALAAFARFEAFLALGVITAAERDAFIAKLEVATVKAEEAAPATAQQKAAARSKRKAADAKAKAAMLASFEAAPALAD